MTADFTREAVTFRSGDGSCAAWLYKPDDLEPHPVAVLGHGLGGVKSQRLSAFAERFAANGIAAFAFDYRHFGESDGHPRQVVNIRRQLEDWTSAVQYVRERRDIDERRVALWGTSFAGGHVHVIAARDPAVAAIVAQVPFVDGRAAARATGTAAGLRCAVAAIRDVARAAVRRPPFYVPLAGPPGTLAAMTAPGAHEALQRLIGPDDDDYIAARIFLSLPGYRPGRRARDIRCPALYVIAQHDQVTPPEAVERVAASVDRAEVVRYPVDHFDVYTGDVFERVATVEVTFLRNHLLSRPAPVPPRL